MIQDLSFRDWCNEIDRIAHYEHGEPEQHITEAVGRRHFLFAFGSGMTPSQAFTDILCG